MTVWTIAGNDIKLTIRDKMFFFWLLIFPLLFAAIFGFAFRGSGGSDRKVALRILDKDESPLSLRFVQELSGEKYDVILLQNETEKSYRTLIIPKHFGRDILAGQKVELVLERERESNLEASQAAASHIFKAAIKVLTQVLLLTPEELQEAKRQLPERRLERLVTLKTERGGKLRAIPSGFNHSVPGTTVMFIIFTILMYGGINLLQERRLGQLERVFISPASFSSIIAGKWIGRVILGILQVILVFAAGKILFKTYLGDSPLALFLVAFFFSGTIAGMSMLLGSIVRKIEVLIILNIFLANIMAALGGCWWPLELVPAGIKRLGYIFPTGWTMDAFHKIMFFGENLASVLPHIAVLTGFTAIFLVLAVKFFRLR